MQNSEKLYSRSIQVIPGGVNSGSRNLCPFISWSRGQGSSLWDVDGKRYTDFHGAWGPIILGYQYPYVVSKVVEAVKIYDLYGTGVTELEVLFAERILRHFPSGEMVLACNSGSEATFHAIRMARACTGRRKIIKFQGCFHGWNDYVTRNFISKPNKIYQRDPMSAGMLDEVIDSTLVCRLNDLEDVERVCKAHEGDIAAIIVEPLAHNIGCVFLKDSFLRGLRSLCDTYGILLIFDEIVTGFRVGIGGYQEICRVSPDITTIGKAIANGYPIAALIGKKKHMERFTTHDQGDVFYAGTYNGHPVPLAAALATMDVLESQPVYEHIFRLGDSMRRGLQEIAARYSLEATVVGFGSVFVVYWGKGSFNNYEDILRLDAEKDLQFRRRMIEKRMYFVPVCLKRCLFFYSHTESDKDEALNAAEEVLGGMAR